MFWISATPSGWFMIIMAVACALILPLAAMSWVASFFPEVIRPFVEWIGIISFPILLCYLHSKKVFGTGRGSLFFRLYTIFFIAMGGFMSVMALIGEKFLVGPFIFGVIVTAVGITMLLWGRKVDKDFAAAVVEDEINMQAEAILRAEQLKKQSQN